MPAGFCVTRIEKIVEAVLKNDLLGFPKAQK